MCQQMWKFATKDFRVQWDIHPCDDLDLSWDETGETARNLDSGLWSAFDSEIRVFYRGREIASQYLGQSIYENPADFRDHVGSRGAYGSYFTDMVKTAIAEARQQMREEAKRKTPYIRNTKD